MKSAVLLAGLVGLLAVASTEAQPCKPEQIIKLLASDGATQDLFGSAVAVSGDTALIGASNDDDHRTDSGAVYVFHRSGDQWMQVQKLTASDAPDRVLFGSSVSLDGDIAVVGATGAGRRGAAYIFEKSGDVWGETARLTATEGTPTDQFGRSVSISGPVVIVGAMEYDSTGVAIMFEEIAGEWEQVAVLVGDDSEQGDRFGRRVAVSGETAIVGTFLHDDQRGGAYIFEKVSDVWEQTQELVPSDGHTGNRFGFAVAILGDLAVVGAQSTGAYMFERMNSVWTQVAKLTPSGGTASGFGISVAIDGEIVIVGADTVDGGGATYVFERVGNEWTEVAILHAADQDPNQLFGNRVAVSGYTALVGSPQDNDLGENSGSAYLFALCEPCRADVNEDGFVDTRDFLQFLGAWVLQDPIADWDKNGTINTLDFVAYLNDWVAGC